MTLPGGDFGIACTLLAALGDFTRFHDGDHAASYLGLVPSAPRDPPRHPPRGSKLVASLMPLPMSMLTGSPNALYSTPLASAAGCCASTKLLDSETGRCAKL